MKLSQFVEVFITDVDDAELSKSIQSSLASMFEGSQVSFDLQDVDRVLRIASPIEINADAVAKVLATFGFHSEVMPETEIYDLQARPGSAGDSQISMHSKIANQHQ